MSDSHDSKHAAHAGHSAEEVDRHVRAAYYVFGSLLMLTGFTVGATSCTCRSTWRSRSRS